MRPFHDAGQRQHDENLKTIWRNQAEERARWNEARKAQSGPSPVRASGGSDSDKALLIMICAGVGTMLAAQAAFSLVGGLVLGAVSGAVLFPVVQMMFRAVGWLLGVVIKVGMVLVVLYFVGELLITFGS